MPDILHRIGVLTPDPSLVYEALTTVAGLAGWWTQDTRGSSDPGGVLQFRFPPVGGFDPSERVVWRVTDGPAEWIGTTIQWNLHQAGRLHHRPSPFMLRRSGSRRGVVRGWPA